jgi:RNA 2',3'-cyclic 3'-phosphodiesterase
VARDEPALRLVGEESLHVTLVFLGWQDVAVADEVAAALLGAARPLGELEVTGGAWLPPRRPGVLVADMTAPDELLELQRDLAGALSAFHEPETRPFRPHVTVARVRRGERVLRRELPPAPSLRVTPEALVLYRSHLGRGGATYEALASAPVT